MVLIYHGIRIRKKSPWKNKPKVMDDWSWNTLKGLLSSGFVAYQMNFVNDWITSSAFFRQFFRSLIQSPPMVNNHPVRCSCVTLLKDGTTGILHMHELSPQPPPNFDVVLEKLKMWRIWKFHLKCLFETNLIIGIKKWTKSWLMQTIPHLVAWKLMVVRWSFPFGDAIFSSASC